MMSNLEKWRNGIGLEMASIEFADPFQREKYIQSQGMNWEINIKILLYADLFTKVSFNQLQAFGFLGNENPEIGPKLIPAHIFEERPVFADCENGIIRMNNWIYERIKIVDPSIAPIDTSLATKCITNADDIQTASEADISNISHFEVLSVPITRPDLTLVTTKRGGGRSNTYQL